MILENIVEKMGSVDRSGDWFRTELLEELGTQSIDDDFMDTGGFTPGSLYFFAYKATTKKLPFYDMYPLSYVIEMYKDGFLGCNLHYVTFQYRDEIAKSLLNNSAQGAVAVPRRTLHKYLYSGVTGLPHKIPDSEWSDVAQLPTEKFVDMRGIKVSNNRVYNTN
jgi:hypothetical protein